MSTANIRTETTSTRRIFARLKGEYAPVSWDGDSRKNAPLGLACPYQDSGYAVCRISVNDALSAAMVCGARRGGVRGIPL